MPGHAGVIHPIAKRPRLVSAPPTLMALISAPAAYAGSTQRSPPSITAPAIFGFVALASPSLIGCNPKVGKVGCVAHPACDGSLRTIEIHVLPGSGTTGAGGTGVSRPATARLRRRGLPRWPTCPPRGCQTPSGP